MADPILLPDCPDLRARAEAIARARHARIAAAVGVTEIVGEWNDGPMDVRDYLIDAALAELRDLSTDIGRDQGCRLLWALLTGQEPEWCPGWIRLESDGFKLCSAATRYAYIIVVDPGLGQSAGSITEDFRGEWWVQIADVNSMTPAEALAAAINAALDWRRGVFNG